MSTMVNLGIWISINSRAFDLSRHVNPDEKMSICSSTPQHGGYTNSSLLESDVKVRKCHAMLFLRTLYEPKMDVILTIRFKITAEIGMTKHMFCVLRCRRGRVLAFCEA